MKAILACFFTLLILIGSSPSWSQTGNTIGLIRNDIESYNGYTMMSPINSGNTYLIDNCGEEVNRWTSEYNPALTSHLTRNGNLLRTGRVQGTFYAGGAGGFVQLFDWSGDLIWESKLGADFNYHQHHDVKPMPNGNILVLAWEYNSPSKAIQLGRYPDEIADDGMWTELILEIKPVGLSDFLVEWEWHMNDHLIQNFDQTKDNYGVLSEHPELININYEGSLDNIDRFHANALDYNEELDQIVINSRNYNEFYIIDHSTSSEESASHIGGMSGKGGDILYRYGNPITYDRGTAMDQKFYSQHGTNWIDQGQYKNGLIVFNNGINRPQGSFSSVEIVVPEMDGTQYVIESNTAFGPSSFNFAYVGTPVSSFFSARLSNAVVLPNENILITEGQIGKFFEITPDKEIVWEYINPVLGNNISTQGDNSPKSDVFASERYTVDYNGLVGDLIPSGPIELNSNYDCDIVQEEVALEYERLVKVKLLENPIVNELIIVNEDSQALVFKTFDLFGREVLPTFRSSDNVIRKNLDVSVGCYFLQIINEVNYTTKTFKIIKD